MVEFEICGSTGQWSRYTAFYVTNRDRIIPGYKVVDALLDVKNVIRHGRAAILTDKSGEAIGIGSFVLGLEQLKFQNKEIAVLGNSFFVDRHRSTRTFVRGLQVLAEQIGDMGGAEVKEVRIPSAANNDYTNGLYRKFADRMGTMNTAYGPVHLYTTTFEQFAGFCGRFR